MLSRLRTKAQRFFAVTMILFLATSAIVAYRTETVIAPSRWYFFTADGSHIDLQSPNGRLIIETDSYPEPSWPAFTSRLAELSARCDAARRQPLANPIGASYRGVELCNTVSASGDEFEVRNSYFKSRVDELYSRYYSELIAHYSTAIGVALIMWLVLLGAWRASRWVVRGQSS